MRKAISVTVGKLIVALLSIYIWKVYSDNLTLAEIGIITLLVNFDAFFGLVSASPFGNFLSLTALSDLRNKLIGQKITSFFTLSFILSICASIIFYFYSYYLDLHISFALIFLFIAYIYINNTIPIIPTLLAVINKTELSLLLQVIKSLTGMVALIVVFLFIKGIEGWILASIIGVLIPGLIFYFFYKRHFSFGKVSPFTFGVLIPRGTLIKFILPFALMQLLMWYFFSSYRIYSGKLFDLEFLGKLGLAFTFSSQFCSAFDSVITQIYQADFYRIIDEPSKERKLEKFGFFLKKVQPAYLLFFVFGFLPFVIAFKLFLKPEFTMDIILLLSAWIFNNIKISMNLYGLIVQVLMSPKVIIQFILAGVCLSLSVFGVLYFFYDLVTENLFMIGITAIPLIILILLINKISKWVNQSGIMYSYVINLFFCASILLLFGNIDWFSFAIKDNQIVLFLLAFIFLSVIGVRLLSLQRKLREL